MHELGGAEEFHRAVAQREARLHQRLAVEGSPIYWGQAQQEGLLHTLAVVGLGIGEDQLQTVGCGVIHNDIVYSEPTLVNGQYPVNTAIAHYNRGDRSMWFTPPLWRDSRKMQVQTIAHEAAHAADPETEDLDEKLGVIITQSLRPERTYR